MPISDHYRGGQTEKMAVAIVTCDPSVGRIEGVGRDAAVIQIGSPQGALVRWPKEGEYWIVRRENGLWQLDSLAEASGTVATGDSLLESETLWTPSGERFLTTISVRKEAPINPKYPEFGAIGDGSTNDAAALQAAANKAAGGALFVPPGAYQIDAQINLPNNIDVTGAGEGVTVLRQAAPSISMLTATNKSNVHLSKLTLDGNKGAVTGGNPINFVGTTMFSIVTIEVKSAWNNSILIDAAASEGRVEACYLHDGGSALSGSGGHGVALSSGCIGIVITGNRLKEIYSSGVNVSDSYRCVVNGNSIERATVNNSGYGGIRCSNGAAGNSIVGNAIRNMSRGVFLSSLGSVQRNTVSGNVIEGAYNQGILVESSLYNTVTGNTLYNCTSGVSDGAIRLADATYNVVGMNTIIDNRVPKLHTYGVRETGASDFNKIAANVISGFLTAATIIVGANSVVS
jgi:parallel beta-helix repeat protein